ncbi:MAG: hypothetical protein BRC30_02445 [Nanohaloarchaea archaeon SW_7_46_7]|nr:MAG: hypothetical protein BRC30_02445 [Nanohaloarchaea archaeon SW_7_46_7]
MVSVLSNIMSKFTSDDQIKLEDMDQDELEEERTELKAELDLKRQKHEGLAERRRTKFKHLKETDDDMLKEELAEEIASVEDEMSIYHNEHAQIMDALRVIDGLIAMKRKQKLMEDQGLVQEIQDMDQEQLVDTLKQQEVQQMIQREDWKDLEDVFRGELQPRHSGNKKVQEIIQKAEEHKDEPVEVALDKRDRERESLR